MSEKIRILNVMESLGIGGGQIMMFELSNGINKYFGDRYDSIVAGIKKDSSAVVVQSKLLETYGIPVLKISYCDLNNYCIQNKIDIVVHHRISISSPIKSYLPKQTKYIVVSHTAASLGRIRDFYQYADYVVSVCNNLLKCSPFLKNKISFDRLPVILNGIENDFVKDVQPMKIRGNFISGRCHRLVPTKFSLESLAMFEKRKAEIGGHVHYLLGTGNKALPAAAKGKDSIEYIGEVTDKILKYRYLKSFDVYYYEIFSNEGASIAVLESLSCGIPVICLNKGGIRELVVNGVNGFIEKDRNGMIKRLASLRRDKKLLESMKETTRKHFDDKLHIRHCAKKYICLFERLMSKNG